MGPYAEGPTLCDGTRRALPYHFARLQIDSHHVTVRRLAARHPQWRQPLKDANPIRSAHHWAWAVSGELIPILRCKGRDTGSRYQLGCVREADVDEECVSVHGVDGDTTPVHPS